MDGYERVGLFHYLLADLDHQIGVDPLSETFDAVKPVRETYGALLDRGKFDAAATAALGGHFAHTNLHTASFTLYTSLLLQKQNVHNGSFALTKRDQVRDKSCRFPADGGPFQCHPSAMESQPTPAPYAVTTLQLLFTGPAMALLAGSAMPTTFNTRRNHRVPAPGERFRLFTAKGPVLFEVLEREFQFLSKSTTVRLTLDIPSEP